MVINSNLYKYINIIGKFWLADSEKDSFTAQLVYRNPNYFVIGNMLSIEQLRKIDAHKNDICFYGVIDGVQFSLLNCSIPKSGYRYLDIKDIEKGCDCSIEIKPSEIVFGECYISENDEISGASALFDKMDEFIKPEAFDFDYEAGKRLSISSRDSINVNSRKYKLVFQPQIKMLALSKGNNFKKMIITKFIFNKPEKVSEARRLITYTQFLFSILKLNYIELLSLELIKFHSKGVVDSITTEYDVYYHMNSLPYDLKELWPVPSFCLNFEDIESDFGLILDNWFDLCSKAEPVVELFYQILIKKSFDINKFLNYVQAFEVYSNCFRKDDVKKVRSRYPRGDKITAWHKVFDLISLTKDCFSFENADVIKISDWIVDTRNYYTHYGRKDDALTSFEERGLINRLMEYILTIAIYVQLGISLDLIKTKFYHAFLNDTINHVKELIVNKTKSD